MTLVEVAINVRSVLLSAVFRKSLKLSNSSKQKFTSGNITNLMAVDAQRLLDNIPYISILWGAPYQVILAITLLYNELGIAAIIGCVALIILLPPNILCGKQVESVQAKQLIAKDSRIKVSISSMNIFPTPF